MTTIVEANGIIHIKNSAQLLPADTRRFKDDAGRVWVWMVLGCAEHCIPPSLFRLRKHHHKRVAKAGRPTNRLRALIKLHKSRDFHHDAGDDFVAPICRSGQKIKIWNRQIENHAGCGQRIIRQYVLDNDLKELAKSRENNGTLRAKEAAKKYRTSGLRAFHLARYCNKHCPLLGGKVEKRGNRYRMIGGRILRPRDQWRSIGGKSYWAIAYDEADVRDFADCLERGKGDANRILTETAIKQFKNLDRNALNQLQARNVATPEFVIGVRRNGSIAVVRLWPRETLEKENAARGGELPNEADARKRGLLPIGEIAASTKIHDRTILRWFNNGCPFTADRTKLIPPIEYIYNPKYSVARAWASITSVRAVLPERHGRKVGGRWMNRNEAKARAEMKSQMPPNPAHIDHPAGMQKLDQILTHTKHLPGMADSMYEQEKAMNRLPERIEKMVTTKGIKQTGGERDGAGRPPIEDTADERIYLNYKDSTLHGKPKEYAREAKIDFATFDNIRKRFEQRDRRAANEPRQ